jgi:hypothetical protein
MDAGYPRLISKISKSIKYLIFIAGDVPSFPFKATSKNFAMATKPTRPSDIDCTKVIS